MGNIISFISIILGFVVEILFLAIPIPDLISNIFNNPMYVPIIGILGVILSLCSIIIYRKKILGIIGFILNGIPIACIIILIVFFP